MPKIQNQSTNYDYNVTKLPINSPIDDKPIKDLFGTFRDGCAKPLGIVSERYKVVNNADVLDPVEKAFEGLDMTNYKRNIRVVGNGERMYATYTFKNQLTKIPKVGDEVGFTLTAVNSFDRSNRLKFLMGLLRLACTNGMVTLKPEMNISRLHSNRLNINFIKDTIKDAVKKFEDSTLIFMQLADVAVSQEQGRTLIKNLGLTKPLREGVTKIWNNPTFKDDEQRNLYNVYNAATQHLTHEVEPTRYEYAQDRSRNVLKTLTAARDSSHLEKLLIEPKPENN